MAWSWMPKNPASSPRPFQSSSRVTCEDVRFAEIGFVRPITPRIVIEFSQGLSLLLEDRDAIELAAEFIAAFRRSEVIQNEEARS